jgi:type IX secretion system PorP/SprF family membrane protein
VIRPLLLTLVVMFTLGSDLSVFGQDIHFSQFANSPLNINPGQNGVFGGDMRFIGNYRRQWASVPIPYTTFSGSVENKFYFSKGKYDRFISGGVLLNYDKQGSLNLTSINAGIPIALTLPVQKNTFFTIGVTPAFGQRSFGTDKLTFDAQYVTCFYDPAASTRESQVFTNSSLTYFDLSAGANLRFQASKSRSKLDVGGGVFHINQPSHNFWGSNGDVRLRNRNAFTAHGILQMSNMVDLVGMALHQRQGTYREWVFGLGGRYHLNTKVGQELAIQGALGFRSRYTDAIVPQVEVLWKTWQFGLSYDINASNFDLATNRRGGPEVSVIYRLYRVKPLPHFKTCPII